MKMTPFGRYTVCVFLLLLAVACNSDQGGNSSADTAQPLAAAATPNSEPPDGTTQEPASEASQDTGESSGVEDAGEEDLMRLFNPWTGELSDMVDRGFVRALVPWSDTYYYLDGAKQKGIAYEAMAEFEKWLNKELGSGTIGVRVVVLPVRRDQMLTYVAEGRGDLALGGITITEEREGVVDFTEPASKAIQEWLVESPSAENLSGLDDLAGRKVFVRKSSSYWESLQAVNAEFQKRGLDAVDMQAADEYLSTEDLMHMANANAIPYTVADSEIAEYWSNALPDVRVRKDIVLRSNARYGWAIRKNSPEFMELLNRFLDGHRQGTLLGNVVMNRYLKDTSRLHNIHDDAADERFNDVYEHFDQYAAKYGFDALMMVAQGFQESKLDQSLRSHRGAVGIMQLLPSTAAEPQVDVDDITTAENNILAGIKYLAWIRNTYLDDPALDDFNKTAMAFASYNAGPNRIRGLREKAQARGLNPNVWFENVELIAAKDIGSETVDYVGNIFKYYVAYKLSREQSDKK